jgi:Zn-dependent protease with chaperone function
MTRWRPAFAAACTGLAAIAVPARAAEETQLREVQARLALAAAPWCGKATELQADGRRVCTLTVTVLPLPQALAANMLDRVVVSTAFLSSVSADELAAVLGHEFAHFALGHGRWQALDQARGQALPATVQHMLDGLPEPHAETPTRPQRRELDADGLGQLLALRAGYNPAAAARLFAQAPQRLAGWQDAAAGSASHPPTPERAQALATRAASLCQRLRAGQPLLPAEERLLPAEDYRREEAASAPLPPASACAGVR